MMTRGLCELTGEKEETAAWKRFFAPGDTVGIKVSPVGQPRSISHFPYTIERCGEVGGRALVLDRRLGLPDREPFRVSRRHCVLVRDKQGLSIVDATSRLGTVVNGVRIGGSSGRRRATLKPGTNEIALGGPGTPYIFDVALSTAAI